MECTSRVGIAHHSPLLLSIGGRCPPYKPVGGRCPPYKGATLILAFLIATGCGGPAYEYDAIVTGTVTIDGDLAKSGTVTFHPAKDGKPAIGRIYPDGSYSLRTGQGDLQQVDGGTVIPGEYLITVSVTAPPAEGAVIAEGGPPVPGPSLVAAKYAQKETTDLRHTVKPGKQVIVLNLEGAEPTPTAEESPETTAGEQAGESDDGSPQVEPSDEVVPVTPPAGTAPGNAAPEDAPAPESPADNPAEDNAQ